MATENQNKDIIENELATSESFAKFRTILGDGKPSAATKEQAAKVLGGLIPEATRSQKGLLSPEGVVILNSVISMRQNWGGPSYIRLAILNGLTQKPSTFFICYNGTFDVISFYYDNSKVYITSSLSKISKSTFGYVMEGNYPIVYIKINAGSVFSCIGALPNQGFDRQSEIVSQEPSGIVWLN